MSDNNIPLIKDYNRMLEGKRAFITTGARGIGKAIALLFAQQGAVIIVGSRNEPALVSTMEQIKQISDKAKGYVFDLSQGSQTEKVCDDIIKDFGGVDILVNTVGVNKRMPAHEYDDATIEQLLETNFKSVMRCCRKFIPGMIERGAGSIINISSIHSEMTMPGYALYSATKGAMNASARAMALDYARTGIRVNNICPGLILSDTVQDEINTFPEGEQRNAFLKLLDGMQPLPPGSVDDIANAALYLASDMSNYITGQTIFVDGGASIKAHP
jgi:NAD(P)-dependent dehydrogenase (short-subunit alcohol dehydrogenase family)